MRTAFIRNAAVVRGPRNKEEEFAMNKPYRIGVDVLILMSLSVCLILALAGPTRAAGVPKGEPVRIGTILSITGPASFVGARQLEVFTSLIDDINARGGIKGRPVQFLYEDDQSVLTNTVIAATKLIRDKGVLAVVGTSTPDAALAIVPICEQQNVVFINSGPANIPFKKWIFSVGPGDGILGTALTSFGVKGLGAKRIAILHDASSYGMFGMKVITEKLREYPNTSVVAQESIEGQDTNAIPQLTNIKSAKPDLMILWVNAMQAGVIAKNYNQLAVDIPVLTSSSVTIPQFVAAGGKFAEKSGWIFRGLPMLIAEKLPPDDPYRKNVYDPFKKLLQEKYGANTPVTFYHAAAHDAVKAILSAMQLAPVLDRASVREALEKIRFEGFLGRYDASATIHQAVTTDPLRPMVLKNGEFELWMN
jgi:branched-chain amino acid transport system substrate-binding protein